MACVPSDSDTFLLYPAREEADDTSQNLHDYPQADLGLSASAHT